MTRLWRTTGHGSDRVDDETRTVSASDWIALVQSAFLAVGAHFAWRAYRLSRVENGREPRRRLIAEAIEELKGLALESETQVPGVGMRRSDLIAGRQRRLAVALAFMPWADLRKAWELTALDPDKVKKDAIEFAAADLNYTLKALDAGWLDSGDPIPWSDGDRAPVRPRPTLIARLWSRSRRFRRQREAP